MADAPSAGHSSTASDWRGRTIWDAFRDAVASCPDKLCIVAGDRRMTYSALAQEVEKLASSLHRMGIGKGDVISIQLPNWLEFATVHIAATRLGAITNPLLPIYREKELAYILGVAKSKLAFIPNRFRGHDYPAMYRGLRSGLPELRDIIVVGDEPTGDMPAYRSLLDQDGRQPAPVAPADGADTSVLIFTSGTEASPKGVMHSHDTMMFGNIVCGGQLGLGPDEVIWAVSPIGHATGLQWSLRQAIVNTGTVVLQDIWDVEQALDLIERERCTFATAATSFVAMLLESETLPRRDLSSFRTFMCGGAAIPAALGRALKDNIGCDLVRCWGMSECFVGTASSVNDDEARRFGTDGNALPGTEMAIFDDARATILPPGEIGEMATRGPHISLGYFNDPVRTAETFIDGWLFSNDLGFLDADGYLHVVGRKKDIINRGGLKISAAEVEEALLAHPAVSQVAVVAIPDDRLGERAVACVVTRDDADLNLAELIGPLKEAGLATYKWPEYIARLPALPMTPTGKIQKFVLRDDLVSGRLPMQGGR